MGTLRAATGGAGAKAERKRSESGTGGYILTSLVPQSTSTATNTSSETGCVFCVAFLGRSSNPAENSPLDLAIFLLPNLVFKACFLALPEWTLSSQLSDSAMLTGHGSTSVRASRCIAVRLGGSGSAGCCGKEEDMTQMLGLVELLPVCSQVC